MKEKIILVGGGGHCRSIIDVIESKGLFEIAGIVDVPSRLDSSVLGYKVIANDKQLPSLAKEFNLFCLAIGHTANSNSRRSLYHLLMKLEVSLPIIISPYAYVARSAVIKEGSVVMHHCTINANARLGVCTIANTGSIVEHDVTIGNHCHIGPGSVVNGGCQIDEDCFIGSNSVLLPGITISKNSTIAAGSVIRQDVEPNSMYAGNPGKLKKRII